jgi:hypothetical protein
MKQEITKHIPDAYDDTLAIEDGTIWQRFNHKGAKKYRVGTVRDALNHILNPPSYGGEGCDEWAHICDSHMSDPLYRAFINAHHQGLIKVTINPNHQHATDL